MCVSSHGYSKDVVCYYSNIKGLISMSMLYCLLTLMGSNK